MKFQPSDYAQWVAVDNDPTFGSTTYFINRISFASCLIYLVHKCKADYFSPENMELVGSYPSFKIAEVAARNDRPSVI